MPRRRAQARRATSPKALAATAATAAAPAALWTIVYSADVLKDVKAIGRDAYKRATTALEKKLSQDPDAFTDPLRSPLQRLRKFKMSHVRVAVYIDDTAREVLVLLMGDRDAIWVSQQNEILARLDEAVADAADRRGDGVARGSTRRPKRKRS